ncbi:PilZ domain-containing protein [Novosphingobium sp.]|uniref:PilZ domain-containing protein n=1 Tax=Novosphingobium sp. TaxID=1874826 RepID=UPI0025E8D365|nr:PilZ domain-containing protein [Novosphingobium sp.]
MESGDSGQRQIARDSLFVMAELRVDGMPGELRVRVRNLSAGGLMAEGADRAQRGQVVWVNVRNVGWVEGSVAWVQDNRCGIAFREEIDPLIVRAPIPTGDSTPRFVKPALSQFDPAQLRKI